MSATTTASVQELVEHALKAIRSDHCVVIVADSTSANLRWANNTLTTNGVMHDVSVTVIAFHGTGEGTAAGSVTASGTSTEQVDRIVEQADAAARASSAAEDAAELPGGGVSDDWFDESGDTSIEVYSDFAPALGEAFARARAGGRELYGFANHELVSTYLGTSTGLRLRYDQPNGTLELNAKSPDRTRSAWAGRATRDFKDVDPAALDAELAVRLGWAERRIELPAGRYETLLPPTAVADLLIYQLWSASGRDAAEGRTVFSKPGGGTRVGEKLTDLPLTLRSDPDEPGLECPPFVIAHSSGGDQSVFDNGLPAPATEWVGAGVLNRLTTTRHSAALTGLPVAPAPGNLILDGGEDRSLEEMVASTERGLLLTCLWYIREVDPATLLLTGLTRDGVYLVENGEVTGEVNNFRFNESPVGLLGRATEAGRTEKTLPREWSDWFTRAAMPALRVPDFNMSSVSQGV